MIFAKEENCDYLFALLYTNTIWKKGLLWRDRM